MAEDPFKPLPNAHIWTLSPLSPSPVPIYGPLSPAHHEDGPPDSRFPRHHQSVAVTPPDGGGGGRHQTGAGDVTEGQLSRQEGVLNRWWRPLVAGGRRWRTEGFWL